MTTIKADNISYGTVGIESSHYKYQDVLPQSGTTTLTNSVAGGQQVVFELAPAVFNHSKHKLNFVMTPAASGANQYNWMHTDGWSMLRRVQLTTRSGIHIVDVDDVAKLTNMVVRRNIDQRKALSYPDQSTLFSGFSVHQGTPATNYRANNMNGVAYGEGAYTAVGGSNTATPVIRTCLDFSQLMHTLFAEDKSLYLGPDSLYLTITFAPTTQYLWFGTSATNPTTGATIYAGAVAITDLKLYSCIDTNPETEMMLKNKVANGGLTLMYEDAIYNLSSLNGTSQNVSVRYNPGNGKRLKKVYHAVYNNTQSVNTAFDKNTIADAKVQEYYIRVNEKRTTDYSIDTSTFNDYIYFGDLRAGSNMQGIDEFYYNYVIETDFTVPYTVSKIVDGPIPWSNIEQGMPLEGEIKYDFLGTSMTNAQFLHIIYGVVQKELTVTSQGLTVH